MRPVPRKGRLFWVEPQQVNDSLTLRAVSSKVSESELFSWKHRRRPRFPVRSYALPEIYRARRSRYYKFLGLVVHNSWLTQVRERPVVLNQHGLRFLHYFPSVLLLRAGGLGCCRMRFSRAICVYLVSGRSLSGASATRR